MRAGNIVYSTPSDIPEIIPVFPLSGALLLPGGDMPLNIFEPRYMAMTDHALKGDRLIGMIQPSLGGSMCENGPSLARTGCIGRITGFQETGDGRYLISLYGICRFSIVEETGMQSGFRLARVRPDEADLQGRCLQGHIDRDRLLETLRRFLDQNNMRADWDSIEETDDCTLVTALCMMSPYGPAEKQALLEAGSLTERAETLIALTDMLLAGDGEENGTLQ
jgi:Lon protease-like protein